MINITLKHNNKTYSYNDIIKNNYRLSKDKFGWIITDTDTNISYAERNSSENDMFDILYKENFTI